VKFKGKAGHVFEAPFDFTKEEGVAQVVALIDKVL